MSWPHGGRSLRRWFRPKEREMKTLENTTGSEFGDPRWNSVRSLCLCGYCRFGGISPQRHRDGTESAQRRSLARFSRFITVLLFGFILIRSGLDVGAAKEPVLKDVFKKDFLIGAALNQNQFSERDQRGLPIITRHFNSITPENVLKWESVHPQPDTYNFAGPDAYVAFGEKYKMFIIGHTLVWHNQTPRWVFQDDKGNTVDRNTLLNRLRDHIRTVVGRYKGRIKGWDVVNEALNEDGTMRQSPWLKIIGEDYLVKAFEFAHEADPRAQLYYNDYSLENEPKRKGAIELIKQLKSRGVSIDAVGLQGHDKMDWPTVEQQDQTIAEFASLGIKVNITELDIDVLPRANRSQTADVNANAEIGRAHV